MYHPPLHVLHSPRFLLFVLFQLFFSIFPLVVKFESLLPDRPVLAGPIFLTTLCFHPITVHHQNTSLAEGHPQAPPISPPA
ncbi:hypothetical protein F4809DRAFT_176845 [Biscogniauxia mediterranea]|nr:hypothetical protein F4809DRAFT_176845 [Biscogniauxia mediterranea]